MIKEKRQSDENTGSLVDYVRLNLILQEKLCVIEHVQKILFEHSDSKFVRDKVSGKWKLNDAGLKNIKIFNELKALVFKCANKDGSVDTELLKGLVH